MKRPARFMCAKPHFYAIIRSDAQAVKNLKFPAAPGDGISFQAVVLQAVALACAAGIAVSWRRQNSKAACCFNTGQKTALFCEKILTHPAAMYRI